LKIVTVVGARPQFIKAAPVGKALREAGHEEFLVHTGQHYDDAMADIFFRELEIPAPAVNLGVGSGGHGYQTGQMLIQIEPILERERPDWVLVYGDTNSTLAGALAASKLHIRVAHVEAGMRSYNRVMPEETNRVLTDHVSDLLLCPTETAVANLRKEGLVHGVHRVGDVMFDALLHFLPIARRRSRVIAEMDLQPGGYALLTAHRAETVDDDVKLRRLLDRVGTLGLPIVFPVHPRTRKRLDELGLSARLGKDFRVVPPVGYLDMLALEADARMVLTDSGGVQREAFFLGVPSVILRAETEWPELVDARASVLAGVDFADLSVAPAASVNLARDSGIFGRGDASRRIAAEVATR
jgi:UDP-N-acetylglucosamine 2-epimerase